MTDDGELAALIEIERAGLGCGVPVDGRLAIGGRGGGDRRSTVRCGGARHQEDCRDHGHDRRRHADEASSVNQSSDGLLSQLITAPLTEVGFALPAYENAVGFFQPISDEADRILRNARAKMS
jgi:hypothetical protein